MEQMHIHFKPVLTSNLSPQNKINVLESIIFLKEKQEGTIKGIICADGCKKRKLTSK